MHRGAEGSESAMMLERVICGHVRGFSLLVLVSSYASYVHPREELPPEFARVCVAGVAQDQAAKHLALVFELDVRFRDGGSLLEIANRPFRWRPLPVTGPCCLSGGLGSSESKCS